MSSAAAATNWFRFRSLVVPAGGNLSVDGEGDIFLTQRRSETSEVWVRADLLVMSEIAGVLDPQCWMLVGGLMVHLHVHIAGTGTNGLPTMWMWCWFPVV